MVWFLNLEPLSNQDHILFSLYLNIDSVIQLVDDTNLNFCGKLWAEMFYTGNRTKTIFWWSQSLNKGQLHVFWKRAKL